MEIFSFKKLSNKFLKIALIAFLTLGLLPVSFANCCNSQIGLMNAPFWYVGGNIGVSRTHDKSSTAANYVEQTGPGWNVNAGYNFLQIYSGIVGAELGYTQYADSREDTTGIAVARTEHFSSYLAAVGNYPIACNFGVLGKFGLGYSYARKTFIGSGVTASANDYSPYGALGLTYNVTPRVAFIAQAARNWGNSKTGSTDLYSLGVSFAIV